MDLSVINRAKNTHFEYKETLLDKHEVSCRDE